MKRLIEGEDHHPSTLFPECLDVYLADDNPVRVTILVQYSGKAGTPHPSLNYLSCTRQGS